MLCHPLLNQTENWIPRFVWYTLMFRNVHILWGMKTVVRLCVASEKQDGYLTDHHLLLIVTCKVYFAVFLLFCLIEFCYIFIFVIFHCSLWKLVVHFLLQLSQLTYCPSSWYACIFIFLYITRPILCKCEICHCHYSVSGYHSNELSLHCVGHKQTNERFLVFSVYELIIFWYGHVKCSVIYEIGGSGLIIWVILGRWD